MDQGIPNDDERKKLQKMNLSFRHAIINLIILSGFYWIVRHLLDQYPVIQIAVYITMFIAIFYLLLKIVLLNRCPRCSSWGTPVMGGNCPKCGLRLSPHD